MDRKEYLAAFDAVKADFERSVSSFGLPFEKEESCPRFVRDATCCEYRENCGASLRNGWISSACKACRTGERTATFFVSLKCTKNCYFCFNPNQEDYEYYRTHTRDIAAELRQAHASGAVFEHLAITGGEPCLHKPEVLAFLHCAGELYPGVHTRIYTSGDFLDDAFLDELHDAGLSEIRFSVKPQETDGSQEELFERIAAAVSRIDDVVVEMPVIPGTEAEMEALMTRLDALGVRGMNLLEFCFPLCNEQAFLKRGFELRRNPYNVLYNYWYAGGLPVAGSEAGCLHLLEFAQRSGFSMGVHYCSLDNKNSGQVFQQNKAFSCSDALRNRYPWLSFDERDYFLKCAKAFGGDVPVVLAAIERLKGASALDAVRVDEAVPCVAFPLEWVDAVCAAAPDAKLAVCLHVLEPDEAAPRFTLHAREVHAEPID